MPARYLSGEGEGPMTKDWFLDMTREFKVIDNELYRDGLVVYRRVEDFKLQVYLQLLTRHDCVNYSRFTPQRLVQLVWTTSNHWHLGLFNRALGVLLWEGTKHDNDEGVPFDGVYETVSRDNPEDKDTHVLCHTLIARGHWATEYGGHQATYSRLVLRHSWENMSNEVQEFVHTCVVCQVHTSPNLGSSLSPT